MAFSEKTVNEAWMRSKGRCECERATHGHPARCPNLLQASSRGRENSVGAWEAHHVHTVEGGGEDQLSNCEILCWSCHEATL